MSHLFTDNRSIYGPNYLRQCESIDYAQGKISEFFRLHGTQDTPHDIVNCDADGSYGVNAIQGNQ